MQKGKQPPGLFSKNMQLLIHYKGIKLDILLCLRHG